MTDERLDDLNGKVDRGFDRVDADIRASRMETRTEFAAVRAEMRSEFAAVRAEMHSEFASVRAEMKAGFEATQRLIIQVGSGMVGTMILGFASLLVS